jgi:hypothetical protein
MLEVSTPEVARTISCFFRYLRRESRILFQAQKTPLPRGNGVLTGANF